MIDSLAQMARMSKIPKNQVAIFLSAIVVTAITFGGQSGAVFSTLTALGATLLSDYFMIRLRKIEPFFLNAALVSGLIIGLLSFPSLPWYVPAFAGVLAMASKNFIKSNNRHVFNPAAFGLITAGLIFRESVSWWGVIFQRFELNGFSILLLVILLSPVYVSGYRLKKWGTIFGFLITYFLFQFLIGNQNVIILDPLLLFFSIVMLPEPMTTPNNSKLQVAYGIFVAIVAGMAKYLPEQIAADGLIFGLLTGNLIFYKLKQKYS